MRCAVADDQLGVGADVHDRDQALFVRQIDGQHAGRGIGADVPADDGRAVDTGFGMDGQQAAPPGLGEAGRGALALSHFDFGDRAVGVLPDRVHALPEEEIAHGGVAHHHHLVDGLRIDRELFNGVGQVAGQRAQQQLARMLGIVGDARHHVGAAETLRILKRCVRDQFAGFQIEQTQHDRRGTEVHRDAVNWAVEPLDLDAVDQDAISVACDRRIELHFPITARQAERLALDAHVAAPHGVAANLPLAAVT